MGPYGPGGYEIGITVVTPKLSFCVRFSPLSWALGFSNCDGVSMLQVLCIKISVQHTIWVGDATDA